MLVYSMTENEIRNEIAKDTPNIAIQIKYYLKNFIKSNKHRLPRMYPAYTFYQFKTKRNNDILLLIDVPEYRLRNNPHFGVYFMTKTPNGLFKVYQCNTFGDDNQNFIVFTNHFIKRYNERMGLGYTNEVEILKYFIKHNAGCVIRYDDDEPNKFYGITADGMVFGYSNENGFVYQTTFVDNTKLFDNQLEFANGIDEEVNLSSLRDALDFSRENNYDKIEKLPIPKFA